MFCPKCGTQLPNGSKFCSLCGAQLAGRVVEIPKTSGGGQGSESALVTLEDRTFVSGRKKMNGKKIAVALVALVIVLAVFLGIRALLGGGSGNAYAYLSDGRYELITNLKKGESIQIASTRSDYSGTSVYDSLVAFSPDGKYLYYYTKYDGWSGSLCRAEYNKLKKDSSKNDKYIEIIATNVQMGFQFLENGTLLYQNEDDTLYYYDGKESVQLGRNVVGCYTEGSDKVVYLAGTSWDECSLYSVNLKDPDNKTKLASNCAQVIDADDLNCILYAKEEDDETASIYLVGINRDEEKLLEDVTNLAYIGDEIYLSAKNGETLNAYSLVEDDLATQDAAMTEPKASSFSIPRYRYYQLSSSDNPNTVGEIYTSCTNTVYFFHDSIEDSISSYNLCSTFVSKYKSLENADGYFLVTSEIRQELQAIVDKYGQGYDGEWLEFCFRRSESGTTTDYDAYEAALSQWAEVEDRNEVRRILQNEDIPIQTIYQYKDGTLSEINSQVIVGGSITGGFLFCTTDMFADKIPIEDITSLNDVFNYDLNNYNAIEIVLENGKVCTMSSSAITTYEDINEDGYGTLGALGSNGVYLTDGDGGLYVASIEGTTIGGFSLVSDDAHVLGTDGDALYYADGVYLNNETYFCDLCVYKNGTNTRLAQDVVLGEMNLYSDDVILAYAGYREGFGYELSMINAKGEETYIAENVTRYIRVNDSTLLYISDGDLYCYDGKEKKMVETDVDMVWSRNTMEIKEDLNWFD